jgi:beta-glucoside operon transcriptional antiterminator
MGILVDGDVEIMRIKSVVNNNVVMSVDVDNNDCILVGKGIGFGAKEGQTVNPKISYKKFLLADKGVMAKFMRIIDEVSPEELLATSEIISMAKRDLQVALNESIYISLTDHIHYVIERAHEGQLIGNSFLWDIKRYYAREFAVALKAVKLLNKRFNLNLNEDEAGYITFHIINAANNLTGTDNTAQLTEIIHEIINVVSLSLNRVIDPADMNSYRFITHVKFFAQRMVQGIDNSDKGEAELYELVKTRYVDAYHVTQKIDRFLQSKYKYRMSKNDELYFMMHIHRLMSHETSE